MIRSRRIRFSPAWWYRLLVAALVVGVIALAIAAVSGALDAHGERGSAVSAAGSGKKDDDSYSDFLGEVGRGNVSSVTTDVETSRADVVYDDAREATVVLPPDTGPLLTQLAAKGVQVRIEGQPDGGALSLLGRLLPTLIFLSVAVGFVVVLRRGAGWSAGALAPNTALRASAEVATVPGTRFRDVAGCDEAVAELAEVADFYRDPNRFELLGARLPSGIILYGDPGTGKTLLAKALAGEAGLPFYATSGSEFVDKFVGVGASRVRDLFERARRHPEGAVVFIDEIDAVGRSRGAADGNGEREQTLNQILVELDGFSTTDRVVCIAATNRLDVLDPALLRPGRFGRHVAVPLPSAAGRAAILRVHAAARPLADDVDLDELAATMGGLSGAQLAEVVNEAAVMAARAADTAIRPTHFGEGYLRVLAGPKRHSAAIAEGELEVIAAHEAGHVVCAEHSERCEKARQVTIEPRGSAMGLAVYGHADRALQDPEYLHEALVAALGGRAAEQIVFRRISTGAANDLQKATALARRAVEEFGFSARVGQIVDPTRFSEQTRAVVDSEIERMVADAYADALTLLEAHRDELDRLRRRLLEQRVLDRVDILAALGNVTRLHQRTSSSIPTDVPTLAPGPAAA